MINFTLNETVKTSVEIVLFGTILETPYSKLINICH